MPNQPTSDLTVQYVERRAKFKRRAEYNLNTKVLDGCKQLARCANRNIYAYDEQQVAALLVQLREAVADVERAFREADASHGRPWIEL